MDFNEQLFATMKEEEKRKHLREIVHVSNTIPSNEDFCHLRKEIFKWGKTIKTFQERIPLKWIHLERSLDLVRETGINILSFKELADLSSNCSIYNEDEVELFLIYQNNIGNIVYFKSLKNYVILSQKWLADAFKCLVCDSDKVDVKLRNTDDWQALKTRGELSLSLVSRLFDKVPELDFTKFQDHLLNVAELFGIVMRPKTITGKNKIEKTPDYYMPSMINDAPEFSELLEHFGANLQDCKRQPWVCFQFKFLPLSLFNYILFYFMRLYTVCTYFVKKCKRLALFHGMAVFYNDHTRKQKIVLCFAKNAICIQFWEWRQPEKSTYKNLLSKIQSEILRLRYKYNIKIAFSKLGKCADGNIHDPAGWISYEDLDDEYLCEEHNQLHQSKDLCDTWFMEYEVFPVVRFPLIVPCMFEWNSPQILHAFMTDKITLCNQEKTTLSIILQFSEF